MKFAATNSATDRPICWPRELIQAVVNAAVDSALRLLLGGFPEPGELVRHVRLPAGLMPRRLFRGAPLPSRQPRQVPRNRLPMGPREGVDRPRQRDLQAGDHPHADRSFKDALKAFRELGHQRGAARQLESLAWCATCQARDEQAVALTSAAAAIRQPIAAPPKPAEREKIERALTQA
jgi:hypothetical protein